MADLKVYPFLTRNIVCETILCVSKALTKRLYTIYIQFSKSIFIQFVSSIYVCVCVWMWCTLFATYEPKNEYTSAPRPSHQGMVHNYENRQSKYNFGGILKYY